MSGPLNKLEQAGQAVWLDFVDRKFLADGGLRKLIEEDGLTGVTSNPSIFEKAIGHSDAYDDGLSEYLDKGDSTIVAVYESLAIADIQAAADDLRPVYDRLEGKDGYVSLEVSPYLAQATDDTIEEARRLAEAVDRPNLMVKVPGTQEGVPAIRQLIADGLSINVTLLFSRDAYRAVAMAYLEGLEERVAAGQPIDRIASVASFFISRIDAQIDKAIDDRIAEGDPEADALKAIRGKVAIANAKLAYQDYLAILETDRWKALAAKGAQVQRLLWASTGVKDKAYSDVLYIETLIGRDTVNTMPPATMDAFRDHGDATAQLTNDIADAEHVMAEADRLHLKLGDVTTGLVTAGVKLFADAADSLLGAVAGKRDTFLGDKLNGMSATLPKSLDETVETRIGTMRKDAWSRRLWAADATLWTGKDEGKWLGWLAAGKGEQVEEDALAKLAEKTKGKADVVLLGMGGSSLGPEVIGAIVPPTTGAPRFHALDSTDPAQVATVAGQIDAGNTAFLVSSKSGSTLEPQLLEAYFRSLPGADTKNFVAVTDPGSKLEASAKADGFGDIFHGDPAIGGRYSVLSVFGMVPAAMMGVDVPAFFTAAKAMVFACGPDSPPATNPGMRLGAIMGEAALAGRDKLTILPSPSLAAFGSWLEQLVAESTGKEGKGIVPVDLEPLGSADSYGTDRLFVHLHLAGDSDDRLESTLKALADGGHPLVRISVADPMQLGQEFFRWEMATAVAGAIIGIDPFDQPDVEAAKVEARKLVDAYEATGALEPETPLYDDGDIAIFAPGDPEFAPTDPAVLLSTHFASLVPGDYAGFLAYIERNEPHADGIARMRAAVRDARQVATVAGFGPRFLHSTGQAYKGGPRTGSFLEITRTPSDDVAVPGRKASFGTVQLAQARGDLDVLVERGQRVMRVHLKHDAAFDRLVDMVIASVA
ncbi:bifunctional transaldolase/phosoglucose isomerase [Sphingomonas prati]|uniref:Transaldolase n=1 Tax=Sphingomonas prati TaxID=1843237 RepID=A0A7W9BTQ0_9SPHN|nr:bifunctional transaldolase/phosoglucose isomerase [Sphingomonas prati]MBB5729820.1 transaldolase/glucose-6-phosphate isomerase [Sphingomonas prati]GGE89262.1 glucose-6-phosphate isomerase [Sphingomonas prati]